MAKRLHLMGADREDLAIISACLQDAVTCRSDMAYISRDRRFALVLNRFRWEGDYATGQVPERVRTGVHFDGVSRVRMRNISAARHAPLELLAIQAEDAADRTRVLFDFAGGGAILLEAECLDCHLHDLSEPWRTRSIPRHAGLDPVDQENAAG